VQLRVTYAGVEEFLRDYDEQIARGGLLVRGEVPAGLERGHTIELELVTPVGSARLVGEVIQILAGAGVAVTVAPEQLSALLQAARPGGKSAPPGKSAAPGKSEVPEPHGAAVARKIQQALHGDKSQRIALLREPNKMIHGYVVRNPQIQMDEIAMVARMTTVAVEVLVYISNRREWAERSEIAIALVRNPRMPVPIAVRLLDHVSPTELRQLAKQANVREPIARAARKKVIG
jgi:hypothetical protein